MHLLKSSKFETDLSKEPDSASLSYAGFWHKLHSRFPAITSEMDLPSCNALMGNSNAALALEVCIAQTCGAWLLVSIHLSHLMAS